MLSTTGCPGRKADNQFSSESIHFEIHATSKVSLPILDVRFGQWCAEGRHGGAYDTHYTFVR